ncbi:MAG: hypothetical protein GC166_12470 [Alphaproteobacteria bacterium]|nr:hypothetical protein [Alphaproteobacteria bacterium]
MGRSVWAGATALAAAVAVTGAAIAAPAPKCAKSDEVSAIQTAAIQQQLMVAALTCNAIDSFNAFQTGFASELRSSDATLKKMFRRLYAGRQGEAEYHAFKTRLANDSSVRSTHDNAGYCSEAKMVFAAALATAKPRLMDFVSTVEVKEQSPVQSCDIRVAAGLSTVAVVVPKPNPMRVAMLVEPAAAMQTVPVQAVPASAVTASPQPEAAKGEEPSKTAEAQPAKEEEKKEGGWFSKLWGN